MFGKQKSAALGGIAESDEDANTAQHKAVKFSVARKNPNAKKYKADQFDF